MSQTTLSSIIRALYFDQDVEDQYRGMVEAAYARSSAGTRPWHIAQKDQEHLICIFNSMYATF